jgi:hypothetical protein
MPNQPQQRQNMFTRYSGEQVQQIPAGYVEAMGSMGKAYASIGASIAGGIGKVKDDEIAGNKATIESRKADAADKANKLKEQGLDAENAYKAYSLAADSEDKTYTRVKDATSALGGSIGMLKEEIGNKDTTEERRREAALELKQAKVDFAESTKRMVNLAKQTPLTFDSFQESQTKIREQRLREAMPGAALPARPATPATVPTSYYQSPAFQSPFSTGMEDNATKTVAFGGSPKKAEVVGGRVSSVVSPDGTKHRVGGWVSEADLPAINQVVTAMEASSAGNAYGTPSGAETPGPTPAPVEEKVALNGPLNSKYFHTEPLTPINGSSNRDNRHGTIFFEETVSPSTGQKTRTPTVKYNSNQLVNADGSQNADAHIELRRLTLINEVLKSGEYKNTSPDQAERDAADDAFGTVDNALDMPAIRQAYAFVDRNLQNKSNGGIEADMWGSRFELTYGQRPSMFIAQGDAMIEEYITPSAEVALRATANGRMARALENTSSAPERPVGLDESIAANDTALKFWKGEIARLDKLLGDPNTVNHKPTLDALKNKRAGAVTQLEAENKITQSIQTQVSNLDVRNRQFIANQKLAADELALDESVARLDKMGREKTDDIEKLVTRWVGIRPQDLKRTNGFVAQGLRDLPKISQQIPIMINGKPTGKYYSDRLDSGELLEALRKNGDYKTIARLTRNMPTEEQLHNNQGTGIYDKQKKWDESLYPMNRLYELNQELIKEQKDKGGSWASVALMKVRMPNGDLATAGTLQKVLVGAIRESVVGPGNPSNYEQEVLASIIPDPSEILTIPSRQKARLQALATISMLHHYNSMISNGLSPTEETLKMYSKQIGQVLGYEVTPANFKGLYDDWDRQKTIHRNNELIKSPNPNLAKEYAQRLIDSLEARAEASK